MKLKAAWASFRKMFLGYVLRRPHNGLARPQAPIASIPIQQKINDAAPLVPAGDGQAFHFKENILDELGSYFRVIRDLRVADKDAYDIYSRVGAIITPHRSLIGCEGLPASWRLNRPAFGAAWFGDDSDFKDNTAHIRFMYFTKLSTPPCRVELTNGDVYQVASYLDFKSGVRPKWWKRKYGFHISFFISLDGDGNLRLLKELQSRPIKIAVKRQRSQLGRGTKPAPRSAGHYTTFEQRGWDYPSHLTEWAKEYKKTANGLAKEFFSYLSHLHEGNEAGAVRVQVMDKKTDNVATFTVDAKRTSYFFKDRDISVGHNGKKAKIFHIVRPHRRSLGDGRETFVKFHFRGLRKFWWGGYQISLSVPGRDHKAIRSFSVGLEDISDNPHLATLKGRVQVRQIASAWADHMNGDKLAFKKLTGHTRPQ